MTPMKAVSSGTCIHSVFDDTVFLHIVFDDTVFDDTRAYSV